MSQIKLSTPEEKHYMKYVQFMLADYAYLYASILYS